MNLRSFAAICLIGAALAGCGRPGVSGVADLFGGITFGTASQDVLDELAGSRADGSLSSGHGRPSASSDWLMNADDEEAETKSIDKDAPYGVMRIP